MSSSVMVHVRIDERLKADAAATLATMGLSISDAVRVFLTRVVAEQQIPFALKVPNNATRAAMQEVDAMIAADEPARFASTDALIKHLEQASTNH